MREFAGLNAREERRNARSNSFITPILAGAYPLIASAPHTLGSFLVLIVDILMAKRIHCFVSIFKLTVTSSIFFRKKWFFSLINLKLVASLKRMHI